MRSASLFLVAIFLFSCDDDSKSDTCESGMLKHFDMVPYTGQQIPECTSYLQKYVYQENDYFQVGNPCADIVFNPVNCLGITVCEEPSLECMEHFQATAQYEGIVGVSAD